MHLLCENLRQDENNRCYGQHGKREQPVHTKECDGCEKQHHAVDDHADDIARSVAHHVKVAGQAGHQIAGAVL